MDETILFLNKYPEIAYAISICCITFIVLKYFIPKPTSKQKFIVLFSVGIVLGIVYGVLVQCNWILMILGFVGSIGFYEIGIKLIMKKLGINYDGKIKDRDVK